MWQKICQDKNWIKIVVLKPKVKVSTYRAVSSFCEHVFTFDLLGNKWTSLLENPKRI